MEICLDNIVACQTCAHIAQLAMDGEFLEGFQSLADTKNEFTL